MSAADPLDVCNAPIRGRIRSHPVEKIAGHAPLPVMSGGRQRSDGKPVPKYIVGAPSAEPEGVPQAVEQRAGGFFSN